MGFFRKPLFYIPAALVLIIIVFAIIILSPNSKTPARIHSIQGEVQVDDGDGFIQATENMELSEDAVIKSVGDSSAVIVLYEKVIIRLEYETQISLKDLAANNQAVGQQTGTVWTKVANLGGVEQYEIQTPTTTATVRGTTFKTTAKPYTLLVGEGIVESSNDNQTMNATTDEVLYEQDGSFQKRKLTPEEKLELQHQIKQEITILRDLRLREVLKNDIVVGIIRARYHATDEQIAQYLVDIDEGRASEEELRSQVKSIPAASAVLAYIDEIKKSAARLRELDE